MWITITNQRHGALDQAEKPVPLLLADRVTQLVADPGSMGRGTICTETDVTADAWYLHDGYMPAGIVIENSARSPVITVRGFLISWAMPAVSWPRDASFSSWISCFWASRSSP